MKNTASMIDLRTVRPGAVWTVSELEAITQKKRDSREYSFAVLQFRGHLEHRLRRVGKLYTFAVIKDELHILEAADASAYNEAAFNNGMRQMRRSMRRLLAVDHGRLTPEQRQEHEQRIARQSSMLSLMRQRVRPEI